jgi:hypothetical protein
MTVHPLNFRVRIGQPTVAAGVDSSHIIEAQPHTVDLNEGRLDHIPVPSVDGALGIGKPFAQKEEEPAVVIPQSQSETQATTQTSGLLDHILHLFS